MAGKTDAERIAAALLLLGHLADDMRLNWPDDDDMQDLLRSLLDQAGEIVAALGGPKNGVVQ